MTMKKQLKRIGVLSLIMAITISNIPISSAYATGSVENALVDNMESEEESITESEEIQSESEDNMELESEEQSEPESQEESEPESQEESEPESQEESEPESQEESEPESQEESEQPVSGENVEESQAEKFIVKFVDAEDNEISVQTISNISEIVVPEAPKKMGYNFTGWNVNIEEMEILTEDITVKAIYELILTSQEIKKTVESNEVSISGNMPEGAEIEATKLTSYENIENQIESYLNDGSTVNVYEAFDFKIMVNGETYQPRLNSTGHIEKNVKCLIPV